MPSVAWLGNGDPFWSRAHRSAFIPSYTLIIQSIGQHLVRCVSSQEFIGYINDAFIPWPVDLISQYSVQATLSLVLSSN